MAGCGRSVSIPRLRDLFAKTLNILAESPLIGHTNEKLDPPGRSFRYFAVMNRFIIVCEPTDAGIRVARLLYGARDLAAELDCTAEDEE